MIRRLIVPLTACRRDHPRGSGLCAGRVSGAIAQARARRQRNASPFPPVNGAAPSASVGAPSPFHRNGAAPVSGGGFGGGPPPPSAGASDACMKGFVPLREEAEKRGKMIKAASERKAPPDEACKLIGNFGEAEVKMINYVAGQCGEMRNSAADRRSAQGRPQEHRGDAAEGLRRRGAAADAGPAGPSLSEVLGSSAALPEAQP